MSNEFSLPDIPDLSGIGETVESNPFADGWYQGTIVEQRSFTDSNGNDRVFASADDVSAKGDSRNIKLQVAIKRASDGKELNTSYLLNYRPEDLSQETVQAVAAKQEETKKGAEWGPLFREFMVLQRLSKLQTIAGVRQLQRNGNGGLDLKPIFGKTAYFKLGPDTRSDGKYKEIKDLRATAPKNLL